MIVLAQKYANIGFLEPLIETMIQHDPAARPTAIVALDVWYGIMNHIWQLHRSWRLSERDEPWVMTIAIDGANLVSQGVRYGKALVSWLSES